MGELSRENFYAKTATAPRAVQGFFETVFEHFNKRNDICAHHLVQQPVESFATRSGHGSGYGFLDNAVRFHLETRRFDLLKLVFRGLL
jgi:hypothetical protein